MGVAYFIVLEREVPGLDTGMDGKSLARNMEKLDKAARELRVLPLSKFVSIAPEQASEFIEDEGGDASGIELPPLQQFTAEEGLVTIRALTAHAASQEPGVAEDLRECERILSAAALHGAGWHFEIDF